MELRNRDQMVLGRCSGTQWVWNSVSEKVLDSVSSGIAEDHSQGQACLVTAMALISESQCQASALVILGL